MVINSQVLIMRAIVILYIMLILTYRFILQLVLLLTKLFLNRRFGIYHYRTLNDLRLHCEMSIEAVALPRMATIGEERTIYVCT